MSSRKEAGEKEENPFAQALKPMEQETKQDSLATFFKTPPEVSNALKKIREVSTFSKQERLDPMQYAVRYTCAWDVKMPPVKKHMIKSHLVPTVRSMTQFMGKTRRLSVEIHGIPTRDDNIADEKQQLEQLLHGKVPPVRDLPNKKLGNQDIVVVRVLRKSKGGDADEADNSSVVSHNDDASVSTVGLQEGEHSWREHRQYKLAEVVVLKSLGRICEVKLGSGSETVVRDLKFGNEKEMQAFVNIVEKMKSLEKERAQRQVQFYKSEHSPVRKDKVQRESPSNLTMQTRSQGFDTIEEGALIQILVEIVGATDLPVADLLSSDAYVIVRMSGKEIHRTGVIPRSLDPIWTLHQGCLFLVSMSPEEFFASTGGMTFLVKDYDSVGSNDILGSANVPLEDILKGDGERWQYEVVPEKANSKSIKKTTRPPQLYLRFKAATPDDVKFMEIYQQMSRKFGIYLEETYLPVRPPNSKFLKRQTKRGDHKQLLYRVKPCPDPHRPEYETKWMTKEQINAEAKKPSFKWVEASSGELGKVFIEIISCDNLPNMDALSLNVRDKTDAFACLVYEDSIVYTDVIGDCLSPRWMPWCQRAFAFNTAHTSSKLFIALFDHDPELSPIQMVSRTTSSLHDSIGRCVINVDEFLPNTVYTLRLPLFYGELEKHRVKPRGTLTFRMRIEMNDLRKALLASAIPPAPSYVSCARKIDFATAYYATHGVHDFQRWSMTTFTQHIEELESYQEVVDYIIEAAMAVWLWRGHQPTTLFGKTFLIPLHSILAFSWGLLISVDFNRLPAFLVFSIGWGLLACNQYVRRHPSPWHKCRRYGPMFLNLLFSKTLSERIEPNKNAEEMKKYEEAAAMAAEQRKREKTLEAEYEKELRQELGEEIAEAEAGEFDITTKAGGGILDLTVNPLKPILYPIQLELGKLVIYLRIAKSIVLWQETGYAFWVTTASFAAAFVIFWLPWGFLIRWTFRIVVIVVLGPWMAIVDLIYFRRRPDLSDKERDDEVRKRLRSRYDQVLQTATDYRIDKERRLKLKAFKEYLFGKLLISVPRFCEDLYQDIPLPDSFATPYDPARDGVPIIEKKLYGQNLYGDMIPKRDIQAADSNKAKGNSQAKRKFLKRLVPGRLRAQPHDNETTPLLTSHEEDYTVHA